MGVNQNPDPSGQYGGYSGYTPSQNTNPKDDPYNAQWYGAQQTGTGAQDSQQSAGQQQQTYTSGGQQQQFYQPPLSAQQRQSGSGAGASETSSFGISARLAALLSYLFVWVGGIFFLLFERRSRFVRFSAAQSLSFFGPVFVLYFLLRLIAIIPFIGTFLLAPVIGCLVNILLLGAGLVGIVLMIQAYRGITVRLPFFSTYADAILARFSRNRGKTTV